jgi:hypothetical protein
MKGKEMTLMINEPLTEQDLREYEETIEGDIIFHPAYPKEKVQSAKRLYHYKLLEMSIGLSMLYAKTPELKARKRGECMMIEKCKKIFDACFQIDDNETGRGITGTAKDIKDFGKFKGKGDD